MDNQREEQYEMANRGNHHGGYAGKNSNSGSYRGSRGGNAPRPRGNKHGNESCCPMVAAVHSLKRGKLRLARRYAAMSVRLMLHGS